MVFNSWVSVVDVSTTRKTCLGNLPPFHTWACTHAHAAQPPTTHLHLPPLSQNAGAESLMRQYRQVSGWTCSLLFLVGPSPPEVGEFLTRMTKLCCQEPPPGSSNWSLPSFGSGLHRDKPRSIYRHHRQGGEGRSRCSGVSPL